MSARSITTLTLLAVHCFYLFCAIPTPDDYTKPGRKWLTFKNIPDGKASQIDTMQEFQEFMHRRGRLAVILFYDDRTANSKQLFPLWEGLAITLNEVAKVCAISVSYPFGAHLANIYGVKTTPSVHILSSPTDEDPKYKTDIQSFGNHVAEFTEGLSVEGINKAVMKLLQDDCISFPKTEEELDHLKKMVQKRLGKYTVILLTRKKQTTDLFKTLSYKYASDFTFLQIPYSTDLAPPLMEKLQLSKPKDWGPLLFLWEHGSENAVVPYDGKKFDVSSISAFLEQYAPDQAAIQQSEREDLDNMIEGVEKRCRSVVMSTQEEVLQEAKDDCIVAVVSADTEEKYVRFVQAVACAFTTSPSVKKVFWVRAEASENLKARFGIQSRDALIGLSPSSKLYSKCETLDTVEDFIRFGADPLIDPTAYE